jgi:hypothetical protein
MSKNNEKQRKTKKNKEKQRGCVYDHNPLPLLLLTGAPGVTRTPGSRFRNRCPAQCNVSAVHRPPDIIQKMTSNACSNVLLLERKYAKVDGGGVALGMSGNRFKKGVQYALLLGIQVSHII